jgi:hypothetical protein
MAQEDFTIEVCLKTTSSSDIFSKTDGDENYESGEKHFILTNGIPVFAAWGNGTIKGSTAVNDGKWHHIAIVWDYDSGTDGTGKVYVDGVDNTDTVSYSANRIDNSTDTIKLGYPTGGSALSYFNGEIDDFRIWNTARSESQIQSNMYTELEGTESGLMAYYNFEEGAGDTLADRSGNGHDGSFMNNPTRLAESKHYHSTEHALSFDGEDYIDINANLELLKKVLILW